MDPSWCASCRIDFVPAWSCRIASSRNSRLYALSCQLVIEHFLPGSVPRAAAVSTKLGVYYVSGMSRIESPGVLRAARSWSRVSTCGRQRSLFVG